MGQIRGISQECVCGFVLISHKRVLNYNTTRFYWRHIMRSDVLILKTDTTILEWFVGKRSKPDGSLNSSDSMIKSNNSSSKGPVFKKPESNNKIHPNIVRYVFFRFAHCIKMIFET